MTQPTDPSPFDIPLADSSAAPSPAASPTGDIAAGGKKIPQARIASGSILSVQSESCPKCSGELQPGDIVCLKCGYDLRSNTVRATQTGSVPHPDDESSKPGVFVDEHQGGGSARLWGIVGAVVAIGAMVTAGINLPAAGSGWLYTVGAVVLAAYNIAIHTGTGLAALAITARVCEQKFGSLELAAARMFTAFSVFQLVQNLKIPPAALGPTVPLILAAAAYFLVIWGLFRKSRSVTALIVLSHVLLWIVIQLGMVLSNAVSASGVAKAAGA